MTERSRGRQRSAVVAMTAALGGASLLGLAVASATSAGAAPTCSVHFASSDLHPVVNQNITLSWTTSGADELVASWTTAHVPFSGTQVTTKSTPGPASYQVTGLNSGQYCGGAVVNVVFAASDAASSSVPAPTTSSAEPSTSSVAASSTVAPTSAASPSATFPAQSPTGGSSTPWYEQPVNLFVLGLICLLGSVALFNRERVRAVLVRRH